MGKKFLIIQLRRLGDILLTTPIVDILHEYYKDAQIDFLIEPAYKDVITDNPKIKNIFFVKKDDFKDQLRTLFLLRKQKYDYVLDFFCNPRSAWWAFFSGARERLSYDYPGRKFLFTKYFERDRRSKYVVDFKLDLLKLLGIHATYHKTSMFFSDDIRKKMKNFLLQNSWKENELLIALVAPNTRDLSKVKNWRINGFAELADKLITEKNAKILIVWGPGEEAEAKKIFDIIKNKNNVILAPDTNIKELAALFSNCSAVVTCCGGSKHIAVSQDIPTITIFGPTQVVCWNPPDERHIAVTAKNLKCLGCDKTFCEDMFCMKQVASDDVYNAIIKVIQ